MCCLCAGLQYEVFDQQSGDMILGKGNNYHMGRCTSHTASFMAINYIPVDWLNDGLSDLIQQLQAFQWLAKNEQQLRSSYLVLFKRWFTKDILREYLNRVPISWTYGFCFVIRKAILDYLSLTSIDERQAFPTHFAQLGDDSLLHSVVDRLEDALVLLTDRDVQQLYVQYHPVCLLGEEVNTKRLQKWSKKNNR